MKGTERQAQSETNGEQFTSADSDVTNPVPAEDQPLEQGNIPEATDKQELRISRTSWICNMSQVFIRTSCTKKRWGKKPHSILLVHLKTQYVDSIWQIIPRGLTKRLQDGWEQQPSVSWRERILIHLFCAAVQIVLKRRDVVSSKILQGRQGFALTA